MEIKANEAFDLYRELYYEGGVSSVYFWNLDDGFAGVVLLKKGELCFLVMLSRVGSIGDYHMGRGFRTHTGGDPC